MARPTITPHQFNLYTSQIADIYVALEDELFQQIARRLKAPATAGKDYVLQWQIDKMQQLRMLNQETIAALSQTTGIAKTDIEQMFEDVGYDTIKSVDEDIKRVKYQRQPKPSDIDARLEAYVKQTFRDIDNYVNQSLITTNYGEGTVTKMYRKIVEETTAQVLAGNKTINQAMAETVTRWAERGIDTGFIDKAGRTWHLEEYVNTVLRSTVNRTYNELRLSRMQDYGVDLVLVNSYSNARPACAKIQGRVCSMSNPSSHPDYPSIYDFGYGEPWGIRGVNCRHILYPFVPGININNQIQYDAEGVSKEYELTQQQRYYERQIRKAKRSLNLAREIGDEKTIAKYEKLVRNRQLKVREFIAEHNLPRRYDKERVINLSNARSLNNNEQRAINQYISSESYKLNDKLRRGTSLNEQDEVLINHLDAALKKLPQYEGDLSRSIYFNTNDDMARFLQEHVPGKEKMYKEYISTTKGNTYNPEAQVQLYILDARKGRNISNYNPGEQEVLYERGSKFIINRIEVINDVHHILLEEYDE
ncbi:phage minor capsid protein [Metasolibacillus meyeri]|uniref:phage minor capsid protein n=1 Tax=Metasolibacillus meyeri TaxID=1071052 RepID=UPI000D2F5B77|nr:phage minor capsid protein [Metasolibacillus meyeri]